MTRERFPWLHDLLASTSMDGEDTIFAELDNRMSLFRGQGWREDRAMLAALAAEARRFDRRHPPGAPDCRAAWWALGGVMAAEHVMGRLLDELAALDRSEPARSAAPGRRRDGRAA